MEFAARSEPPRAGQILFNSGDVVASVRLVAIGREGCRLPHAGDVRAGEAITVQFLDGVLVAGTVDCIDGETMDIRFDRPVSDALVHYFSPFEPSPTSALFTDGFGRPMPAPLRGRSARH